MLKLRGFWGLVKGKYQESDIRGLGYLVWPEKHGSHKGISLFGPLIDQILRGRYLKSPPCNLITIASGTWHDYQMIYLLFNTLDRILTSSSLRRSRVHLSTCSGSLVEEALLAIIEKHYNDLPIHLPIFNVTSVYPSTTGSGIAAASALAQYPINVPQSTYMLQHTIIPNVPAPRTGYSELQTTRKQPSGPRHYGTIKTSDEPDDTVPLVTRDPVESSGS